MLLYFSLPSQYKNIKNFRYEMSDNEEELDKETVGRKVKKIYILFETSARFRQQRSFPLTYWRSTGTYSLSLTGGLIIHHQAHVFFSMPLTEHNYAMLSIKPVLHLHLPQRRRWLHRRRGAQPGDENLWLVSHRGGTQGHGERDRPGRGRGHQL